MKKIIEHTEKRGDALKKFWAKLMTTVMVLTMVTMLMPAAAFADTGKTAKNQISIVFSHDMHSHLEKFGKIRTVIKEKKRQNNQTFVLDAGDFSMGTPYQTIYKSEASELRMMGAAGYDATTIGNHEFDYRSKGFAQMLNRAKASGDKLPQLVTANIDWEKTLGEAALHADGEKLQQALQNYGAKNYTVLKKGDARIAVFGIFGKESASYAPESGTYFKDPVETARDMVEEINAHEKVDMIVCLSHSGTSKNPDDSEDEILAKEVEGIDLIISGHSHTELPEPIVIGDTVIASAGQYNDNLGTITFTEKDGKYVIDQYKLKPLDKSVKSDLSMEELEETFKDAVDDRYFSKFGYSWDEVLVQNPVEFTGIDTFAKEQGEDTLGSLIADSYAYGVKEAEGSSYEHVDVAVAPSGVIRGSFAKGDITAADAFNVLSLGTGKDGIAGYPLVSVYLTGAELKLAAEIDISISEIMEPARLYCSGLYYTYNPKRLILSKAYDVQLKDESGNLTELENEKLYRVVADLYSAQMLGTVNSMSYGLLSVAPKDKDGNEITDYEEHIIYNRDGSELKEWYALASYLGSMRGEEISEKYAKTEGRKVEVNSLSPIQLLKKPSKFFFMIVATIVLILAMLVLLIVLILKLIRRIRYGKNGLRKKDMMFRRRSVKFRRKRWR